MVSEFYLQKLRFTIFLEGRLTGEATGHLWFDSLFTRVQEGVHPSAHGLTGIKEGVRACKCCLLWQPCGLSAAALPEDYDVLRLMEALRRAGARILPEMWHHVSMRYICKFLCGSLLKPIPPEQIRTDAKSAAAALSGKGTKPR